jgi:hypothetical protein
MEARDEVGVLLLLYDLLELERKLAGDLNRIRLHNILDNYDQRRLEEGWVDRRIQDRRAGLE